MMETPFTADILSSALLKMRLQSLGSGALDAAGRWAITIPEHTGFKLHLVIKGQAWVVMETSRTKYFLRPGDCLLVISGEPLVATNDLALRKRTTLEEALKSVSNGVMTLNGGGDSYTVTVHFQFEGPLPKVLFKRLPPAIHISADDEEAAGLRWNTERLRAEFLGRNVGRALVLDHLAPIILVQILRVYLASAQAQPNWLTALLDPRLSKAIEAMHQDCGKAWSLDKLAATSGLSRAGFALTFKKKVGVTPGEYLTHWRMQSACELLRGGERSIASVADEVGYGSESAFSLAFNQVIGCRPGAYRKMQRQNPAATVPTTGAGRLSSAARSRGWL